MVFQRIASFIVTGLAWLLVGARFFADMIGYATLPDDAKVAEGVLSRSIDLLLVAPWWAVWGFALIATMWLMYVSWPKYAVIGAGDKPKKLNKKEIEYNNHRKMGFKALRIAKRIERYYGTQRHSPARENLYTILHDARSVRLDFKKQGLEIPIFESDDENKQLYGFASYFSSVGVLLRDGHFAEAAQEAERLSEALN